MRAFLIVPALAAGAAACAPRVDVAAEREALRQADSAYSAAGVAKNIDAFLGLYAADAVMYPPNEPTVTGTDAIRRYVTEPFSSPGFSVAFTPVEVQVSSGGGMGYTLNTARLTMTDAAGTASTEEFRDFHVWRKEADGSWKLVVDIWNSPTAMAPPAPAAPAKRR